MNSERHPECVVCESIAHVQIHGDVMEDVRFFRCNECGLIFEDPKRYLSYDDFDFDLEPSLISETEAEQFKQTFLESVDIGEPGELYSAYEFTDTEQMVTALAERIAGAISRHKLRSPGWRPQRILEVGCADGFLMRRLADVLPEATFVGVEPSPVTSERGRSLGSDIRTGILDSVSFEAPFDLVIMVGNWMLHENPVETLASITGLVADDGLVVGDTKNPNTLTRKVASSLARTGLHGHLDPLQGYVSRNFENYRYGISRGVLKTICERLDLNIERTLSLPPRALEHENTHQGSNGLAGTVWRWLDRIDMLREEQAWLGFELSKRPTLQTTHERQ